MTRTGAVRLGGDEYRIIRLRLGGFLALQKANEEIARAVDKEDGGGTVDGLYNALTASVPYVRGEFNKLPWYEIMAAYQEILRINEIPDREFYAILKRFEHQQAKTVAWNYPGRFAILMVHMLASAYNWSREEIFNLWPEEAYAYLQEIIAAEQHSREFLWQASPVAYPYDKASKKARFQPMPRPPWMLLVIDEEGQISKLGKVPKALIPIGRVVRHPEHDKLEK